jgi:predicted Zn-dependent protease
MMFRNTRVLIAVVVLLAAAISPSFSSQAKEEKIGLEQAKEFEKNIKLVTDQEVVERVNRIGQALTDVVKTDVIPADYGSSELADFHYQFKVIDDDDINAVSLPGGIIYVYSGLLDFAQTDDELAGVLAHEVIHSAHHHVMALIRKQSKMDTIIAVIALAGGLGKMKGRDLTNVLYGAQSLRTARLNGYGMQAENDADKGGAILAHKAGFDPRGIIRFLDRLNQFQERRGEIRNLGIFQTHPASTERTIKLANVCKELGVDIDLREAAHLSKAQVESSVADGRETWTVKIAGRVLYTATDTDNRTAKERADYTCKALNELLREGISTRDVMMNEKTREVMARGRMILKVTPADSVASGLTTNATLSQAMETLRYALWSDWLKCGN